MSIDVAGQAKAVESVEWPSHAFSNSRKFFQKTSVRLRHKLTLRHVQIYIKISQSHATLILGYFADLSLRSAFFQLFSSSAIIFATDLILLNLKS